MSVNAISLDNLSVRLDGQPVLSGLTANLQQGGITGLLGPSGAGKTTLMRVLVGLQQPSSGQAAVLGMPAGSRQLRGQVGYMTQTQSVFQDLTVRENLAYFAALAGGTGDAQTVLEQVRLEDFAGRLVRDLSGGQKSRVSLAAALLGSPKVLVLDEPTVGLDPVLRQELWEIFGGLAKSGVTLLVSSHVMDEARRCNQLLLLREGRILAHESPDALMRRTHTETVEDAFLRLVGAPA